MNSFRQADEALQGRNSARRKLMNNTYLERQEDGSIAVKLHNTDVVTYRQNGDIMLDSGGWLTVTTKGRMNEYGPQGWRVYSQRGVWYVGDVATWDDAKALVYRDGMVFHLDGMVTGAGEKTDADAVKLTRKAIRKYADLCAAAVPLPMPSSGDCFYCVMKTEDGKSLGDAVNSDHLQAHIEDGYIVPSLVWAALTEAGYDPQRQIIHALTFTKEPSNMTDTARESVKRAVAKYMARRMVEA